MTWATRNENGDNMGNTFVRAPLGVSKAEFAKKWDRIFNKPERTSANAMELRVASYRARLLRGEPAATAWRDAYPD